MDADKTVGAAFVWVKRTLTVARPAHGHVTGAGIGCGAGDRTDCTEQYDHGAEVKLTAVPDPNRRLSAWSGACSGSATACTVAMDADKTVGAAFVWVKRTLSVTRPVHGHVTGAGISCGSGDRTDCTEQYDHGTEVELTAVPDPNRRLSAWSGACSASASTTCAVLLDGDKTVGAAFVWEKRTLTVERPVHGHVTGAGINCGSSDEGTDCTEQYDHGTEVALKAVPDANRKLSAWSGACSASATTTCAALLDGDKTVGAAFVWVKRKLTVTRPSHGHVTAAGISCGSGGRADCTEQYDHGTKVKLTAEPDTNRKLSAWSGACSASATTTCAVLLGGDKTVGAAFVWVKRKLTVSRSNLGYVTGTGISCGSGLRTDCAENYDHGTKTTLTALGSPGYQLYAWGGACEGASSVYCEVLMDAAKTASATYVAMCGATTLSGCRLPETSWNGTAGSCLHGGSCSYRCTKGQWHRASNTCCSPVDGGWSDWGDCSQNTCGASGTKTRSCTSPSPSCGGAACSGRRTMPCTGNSPVNGGWSDWSECSTACGATCTKTRSCTRPSPACGGAVCSGSSTMPYVGDSPENGACDESVRNGCSAGTANDAAVDDTTTHYKWRCDGKCNGSNSRTCKKQKPGCDQTASWQVTTAVRTYLCSADVDLPSGESLAVSDDDPDDVGKAKFSCDAGVLTEDTSMSECYEYPRCNEENPTSAKNACDWKDDRTSRFDHSDPPRDDSYEDGQCGTADGACAKGNPTAVTTSRVDGKCGDAVDQCANNTAYEDLDDTATQRRWRCKGIDGSKSWSCNGTTGTWKWSCTHNRHTRDDCIERDHTGSDDDDCIGSADPAASATCAKALSCGALREPRLVNKTLSCGCVANASEDAAGACRCDAGFEADGNACKVVCPSTCPRATLATCADADGGNARTVCRCASSSCPPGYRQSGSCSTTTATYCSGDTDGCGRRTHSSRCTTTAHSFSDVAPETCRYEHRDRNWFNCKHQTRVCTAKVTEIGCLPSSGGTAPPTGPGEPGPGSPDPGFGGHGEEEWSEPAAGYILPTFECGASPNSCDVAFEDETLTTTDYGVVHKTDTLEDWLWECHSDNGTVRQCSLPKGGG